MISSSSPGRLDQDRTSTLVIVAGRPGSGKSTLATSLAHLLAWPLVSRDEVNNGLTHVLGASLSKNALAAKTFDIFSDLLGLLVSRKVAFITEAAFQNPRWQRVLEPVLPEVEVRLVHCVVDPLLARDRVRRRKGQSAPAGPPTVTDFDPLCLPGRSMKVSTADGYDPPLVDIAAFARS